MAHTLGPVREVYALAWTACPLWFLGYPDQAAARSRDRLDLARRLDIPLALSFALSIVGAQLPLYRREFGTALEGAQAEMRFAADKGFPFYQGMALAHQGWAEAGPGRAREGMAHIRQGIDVLRMIGTQAYVTSFLAALAEAHGQAGETTEGLSVLAQALDIVERSDERFYQAELHRIRGELLCIQAADVATAEAEASLHCAIEVAQRQRAKPVELRAATSLGRLWQRQGRAKEARELVSGVYTWFTEGHDTADLQEVRALLDELSRG